MSSDPDLKAKILKAIKAQQSGKNSPVPNKPDLAPPVAIKTEEPLSNVPIVNPPQEIANNIEKRSINEFSSLQALNAHLLKCSQQQQDFNITNADPEKAIQDFVFTTIEKQKDLLSFNDAMSIFNIIQKIKPSNNYYSDINTLLKLFEKKIPIFLKENSIDSLNQLELFFDAFNTNKYIIELRKTQTSSINPFSSEHHIHQNLNNIDKFYIRTTRRRAVESIQKSQKNYAQLLDTLLEGASPESIVPLLQEQHPNKNLDTENNLLPKTEFDVPSAEPEHPRRIGINKTMSFIPAKKVPSLRGLFSTKGLIKDFMLSFEWAIKENSLQKLHNAQASPGINLLDTNSCLPTNIQFAVIRYLLLSLDALGKICGEEGELAIQNYTHVNDIIERLKILSTRLKSVTENNASNFSSELQNMSLYLISKNQLFYNTQEQHDANIKTVHNPKLNDFCHINEHLASLLLDINYNKSTLIPEYPSAGMHRKINQALDIKEPPNA